MSFYKSLAIAAVLSLAAAGSASAQFSEPAAYEAMHPDRDVLNGGALTPAARMELERSGHAAPDNANALIGPGGDAVQAGGVAIHRRRHHLRP